MVTNVVYSALVPLISYALIAAIIGRKSHWETALGFSFGLSIGFVTFVIFLHMLGQEDAWLSQTARVCSAFTAFYMLWCLAWKLRYDKRHPEAPTTESTPQGA